MKNKNLELPLSRPLFRFSQPAQATGSLSTNTSWTVMTRTTTACIYDAGTTEL